LVRVRLDEIGGASGDATTMTTNIVGVADNDLLDYNAASGFWENVTRAALNAVLDHGTLAGTTDDDHVRYLDRDGTRAWTGDLTIGSDSTYDIGSTGDVLAEVWADALKSDGAITITPGGGGALLTAADFKPTSDSALDLGATGAVWAEVWADALKSDGDITITASGGDVNVASRLGIGTVVPHGAVGGGLFAIEGVNSNLATGPHIQITTNNNDYPLFQQLNWTHDNIAMTFDGYYDGNWKSSDAGSSYQIYKITDKLRFMQGVAAPGGAITWNLAMEIDTSSDVTFGHDIFPDADSANDIGKTGAVWAEVWTDALKSDGTITCTPALTVSGVLTASTTLQVNTQIAVDSSTDNVMNIRMTDSAWGYFSWHEAAGTRRAYMGPDADMSAFTIFGENGCTTFNIDGFTMATVDSDFKPAADSTRDLGATGAVWAEVWADKLTSDNAVILNGVGTLTIQVGGATCVQFTGAQIGVYDDVVIQDIDIYQGAATYEFIVSGGSTSALGANLLMRGETHATDPDDWQLRHDTTAILGYDASAAEIDFSKDLIPTADSSLDLGKTGAVLAEVWADYLKADADIQIDAGAGAVYLKVAGSIYAYVDAGTLVLLASNMVMDNSKYIYMKDVGGTVRSVMGVDAGDDLLIGNTTQLDDVYIRCATGHSIYFSVAGTSRFAFDADNLRPIADSSYGLGETGKVFAEVWTDALKSDGAITVTPALSLSSTLTMADWVIVPTTKGVKCAVDTGYIQLDGGLGDALGGAIRIYGISSATPGDIAFLGAAGVKLLYDHSATTWIFDTTQKMQIDQIDEAGAAQGVTIETVLIKDGAIAANYISAGTFQEGNYTFDGDVNVGGNDAGEDRSLRITAPAGQARKLRFETSGAKRWLIEATNAAEGGANAGSDLDIVAYNDAGVAIESALKITRANSLATFGGDVLPLADSSQDLGSTGKVWAEVWADLFTSDNAVTLNGVGNLYLKVGGNTAFQLTGAEIGFHDDIIPAADSSLDLGKTGAVLAEVWTDAIKSDGNISLIAAADIILTPTGLNVRPGADSTYTFGNSGAVWAEVWTDALKSDGTITISPTTSFSAAATFASTVNITGSWIQQQTTTPQFRWDETDAAANEGHWLAYVSAGNWYLSLYNDAWAWQATAIGITRTTSTCDAINLAATSINCTGGSNLRVDGGTLYTDTIAEDDAGSGVTIDSVLCKDGQLVLGGDAVWYRSAADTMRTPDALIVDGATNVTGYIRSYSYMWIDKGAAAAQLYLEANAGQSRMILGRTDSEKRWTLELGTSTAEAGANVGSDFLLHAYDDDDVSIGNALLIYRNSMNAYFGADVHPDADSTNDLGKSGAVWAEVWTDAIKADGVLSLQPTGDIELDPTGGDCRLLGSTLGIDNNKYVYMKDVGGTYRTVMGVDGGDDLYIGNSTELDDLYIDCDNNQTIYIREGAADVMRLSGSGVLLPNVGSGGQALMVGDAGASSGDRLIDVDGTVTLGTTQYGMVLTPEFDASATSAGRALYVSAETDAAAFTQTNTTGILIAPPIKGAGSTITNLYGLYIDNQSAGGTLNYAIYTNDGAVRLGDDVTVTGKVDITKAGMGLQVNWTDSAADWCTLWNTDGTHADWTSGDGVGIYFASGRRWVIVPRVAGTSQWAKEFWIDLDLLVWTFDSDVDVNGLLDADQLAADHFTDSGAGEIEIQTILDCDQHASGRLVVPVGANMYATR
jgi:hypothetical protein